MPHNQSLAPTIPDLARSLLDGTWAQAELQARLARDCEKPATWGSSFVRRLVRHFPLPPALDYLQAFLGSDAWIKRVVLSHRNYHIRPPRMGPSAPGTSWQVPPLATAAQLAQWLELSVPRLEWLADCQGRNSKRRLRALQHYDYRWLPKRRSGYRLLEIPKPLLRRIQKRVLHEILDNIPPHDAAHAYRAGRSVASFAAPHAGKRIVMRLDLRDFFGSVAASRIHSIFRTAGYPTGVCRLLTGLCTARIPRSVWEGRPQPEHASWQFTTLQRLRATHLPQGAPTSPALANLACTRLDRRLTGLARSVGAVYTRYADDLAFSGSDDLERVVRRVHVAIARRVFEEGFEPHLRKSRFMRQGVRQQLVGIVVNEHLNVPRNEYEQLKAILFNCVRLGPAEQNRAGHRDFRGHLLGRIAYFHLINPARALKLRRLFDRIDWSGA